MRSVPHTIDTNCKALNEAWARYANELAGPNGIALADTEDALNWDAFISRSVEFEPTACRFGSSSRGPDFQPLRDRGITLKDLADLWEIEPLRDHLLHKNEDPRTPAAESCHILLGNGGPAGQLLCAAFEDIPASRSHWSVRALLQNSAALSECNHSFRSWLARESGALGEPEFPPRDFRKMVIMTDRDGIAQRTLEQALVAVIGRCFHRAGPEIAAHILCDWMLGLWLRGETDVFDLYPHDAHHLKFIRHYPGIPGDPGELIAWWHDQPDCADLPPRIASACIACAESAVVVAA
jgi:hypothetical protein